MAKYVGFRQGKAHESHVISEYYCRGCGYPVTDHDRFCPECGGAFRECDASNLEDENAKLRERIVELEKENGQLLKLARLVVDEFDQLKELANDIVYRMPCKSRQLIKCRTCTCYRYPDGCMIGVRMRKLGV